MRRQEMEVIPNRCRRSRGYAVPSWVCIPWADAHGYMLRPLSRPFPTVAYIHVTVFVDDD